MSPSCTTQTLQRTHKLPKGKPIYQIFFKLVRNWCSLPTSKGDLNPWLVSKFKPGPPLLFFVYFFFKLSTLWDSIVCHVFEIRTIWFSFFASLIILRDSVEIEMCIKLTIILIKPESCYLPSLVRKRMEPYIYIYMP